MKTDDLSRLFPVFLCAFCAFAANVPAGAGEERISPTLRREVRALAREMGRGAEAARAGEIVVAVGALDKGRVALERILASHQMESAVTRAGAALLLSRIAKEKAVSPLAEAAIRDPSETVRAASADGIAEAIGRTPPAILASLSAEEDWKVERAARFVERLRDREGVGALISAIVAKTEHLGGGDSSRGYLMVIREQPYIRDVNAVVGGLGGAALDPEIGHIRSGIVLEAKAVSIQLLRTTLYQISGKWFRSVEEIEAWWDAHKHEF